MTYTCLILALQSVQKPSMHFALSQILQTGLYLPLLSIALTSATQALLDPALPSVL